MNHKRIWALGSVALLAAGMLPAVAAVAAGGTTHTETGCYDITPNSHAAFNDVIQSATQTGDGSVLKPYGPVTYTYYAKAGVFDASLVLSAPSCTDATYTLDVYPDGTDLSSRKAAAPIRSISVAGDGTSGTDAQPLIIRGLFDHLTARSDGQVCVAAQARVSDSSGTVDAAPGITTAQPTGLITLCNDSGSGAQGFGGGQAFGG